MKTYHTAFVPEPKNDARAHYLVNVMLDSEQRLEESNILASRCCWTVVVEKEAGLV